MLIDFIDAVSCVSSGLCAIRVLAFSHLQCSIHTFQLLGTNPLQFVSGKQKHLFGGVNICKAQHHSSLRLATVECIDVSSISLDDQDPTAEGGRRGQFTIHVSVRSDDCPYGPWLMPFSMSVVWFGRSVVVAIWLPLLHTLQPPAWAWRKEFLGFGFEFVVICQFSRDKQLDFFGLKNLTLKTLPD